MGQLTEDRAQPKLPTTTSRLIAVAVSLVGEAQSVMLEMKCSHADLREYCFGLREPSAEEFDRLVELIVVEQRKMLEQNRELLAQARARE
ncbi:MAG TPA: hypothetical protein VIG70_10665 [Burkholderiales bacterium]|jgi:hypothetical protein